MAITEKSVYFNQCKFCKHLYDVCGPIYCYNCGDYYCSENEHKCDPKRVKRHEAAMEAASSRGEEPNMRKPTYRQQLKDGFDMLNPYDADDNDD